MEPKLLNKKRKFIQERSIIKSRPDELSHFKEIIEKSKKNSNKEPIPRKEKSESNSSKDIRQQKNNFNYKKIIRFQRLYQ